MGTEHCCIFHKGSFDPEALGNIIQRGAEEIGLPVRLEGPIRVDAEQIRLVGELDGRGAAAGPRGATTMGELALIPRALADGDMSGACTLPEAHLAGLERSGELTRITRALADGDIKGTRTLPAALLSAGLEGLFKLRRGSVPIHGMGSSTKSRKFRAFGDDKACMASPVELPEAPVNTGTEMECVKAGLKHGTLGSLASPYKTFSASDIPTPSSTLQECAASC